MNKTEYLLACLAEEATEVAQGATKAQRFGLDEVQPGHPANYAEWLCRDLIDLAAVAEMLQEQLEPALDSLDIETLIEQKIAQVEHFMCYSVECGTLDHLPEDAS